MSLRILLLLVHHCVSVFSREQHSDDTRSVEHLSVKGYCTNMMVTSM